MENHHLAAAAAALAAVLSAAPVAACTGTTELFADDFSIADPAWGNYQGTTFSSGQMTIEAEAGGGYMLLNQFALYQDFDICMDVVQHVSDPSTGWASLIFWGLDYDNFYMLDVAGNGYVRVTRVQNARWLSPVSWTLTEGVVNPGEELNRLRVRAKGNEAQIFINGKEIVSFRGQPPDGGGLIGVYGTAPVDTAATFDFSNVLITTPDGPTEEPGFGDGGDGGGGGAPDTGSEGGDEGDGAVGSKKS